MTGKESNMTKNETTVSFADDAAASETVKLASADGKTTVELHSGDRAEINRYRFGLGYRFASAAAAKRAAQ